jgi:hypothetical protein
VILFRVRGKIEGESVTVEWDDIGGLTGDTAALLAIGSNEALGFEESHPGRGDFKPSTARDTEPWRALHTIVWSLDQDGPSPLITMLAGNLPMPPWTLPAGAVA